MNSLRTTARFTGNTSCGFITGWLYEVKVERRRGSPYLWVIDLHGPGRCPYGTIKDIAANWRMPADKAGPAFQNEYYWQRENDRPAGDGWRHP